MNCPICLQAGHPWGAKDGYTLERCRGCLHLYATRRPDPAELSRLYSRYCYEQQGLENVPPFVVARLRELLRPLLRPGRQTRLLDVGFGAGALLKAAAELGFDAHGIETSPMAVAQARSHGLSAEEGDFRVAPWPDASFDVVCMIELIEHLPEPLAFLRKARQSLAPGGMLFLTTPNGASLSARLLGPQWSVVAPPEHLQLFSPRSMRRALAAAGFDVVRVRCEGANPTELAAGLPWRRKTPASPSVSRVATAQALNERLARDWLGRTLKATANAALSLTRLGDSLKVLGTA